VDLFEYQGKQYFARYGLPVSSGGVADTVDEAVAQAVELSVKGADVAEFDQLGLGDNVDNVVGELEALRQGLEEAGGTSALPAP